MKKILVIDDASEIREIIALSLEMNQFAVLTAADGETGVALARQHAPDLIICDINMPTMDGFQTLEVLRRDAVTALIPFIFLTGATERNQYRRGMELGADDFLNKPFTTAELLGAVTARLAKNEAIQKQTEKRLDELRGNITLALPHELRTPLHGIMGLASILMEDYQTMKPAELHDTARHINESALRLHRLIENFLAYAQIELVAADPGRVHSLRQAPLIPVGAFIREVARARAQKANRVADLQVEVPEVKLPMSQEHLGKILEELIDNAFKFSRQGNQVGVSGSVSGQNLVLRFQDRGRGMSAEQIANVGAHMQFERKFYEQQGAGLGLFIAKRLAELYGGALAIESMAGQHTIVQVRLPLTPSPSPAAAPASSAGNLTRPSGQPA
jgi:signal transduction histidine kinase